MTINLTGTLLVVGGSTGLLRTFDLSDVKLPELKKDSMGVFDLGNQVRLKDCWRGHVASISSVNYVHTKDLILSSSKDSTIRVWNAEGEVFRYRNCR